MNESEIQAEKQALEPPKNAAQTSKKELVFDLVLNGFFPWIGYIFLQKQYGFSDYHALLAVTVIPAFLVILGLIRKGRPDRFAMISLVTMLFSLLLAVVSDDARVLQIRESYIAALVGVVFVVSSAIGKPVFWLLACSQTKDPRQRASLERPQYKRILSRVNTVWGWSFLLEVGFKLWMIEKLEISQVLALSPIMFYGVSALTFLWTLWWLKRESRKLSLPQAH